MLTKRCLLMPFVTMILMMLISACGTTRRTQIPSPTQPIMSPSPDILDYFPLKTGAYWVYQGPVRWTRMNSSDVAEGEITWRMEVVRVIQRDDILGYELLGAPWDLAWYEPGKERSKYGIIQAGGRKFYRVSLETLARLSNMTDDLSDLVNDSTIFLDTPLATGERFCDAASQARTDNMYCWVVGEGTPFEAGRIRGIDPARELLEYPIGNQTMPDASRMYFVPGIGISRYSYHHNGTVSEVDVHLIEYYPGE